MTTPEQEPIGFVDVDPEDSIVAVEVGVVVEGEDGEEKVMTNAVRAEGPGRYALVRSERGGQP